MSDTIIVEWISGEFGDEPTPEVEQAETYFFEYPDISSLRNGQLAKNYPVRNV